MRTVQKLPDDLKELLALVRAGKLFAVRKWIAEGRNYGATETHRLNPVYEAMEMSFHSMVEVFLAAGLNQSLKDDLLDMAVDRKRFDLILLCQQYGARLSSVDFESVCETRNPQLIRFFLDHGADAVTGQPFAKALKHACRPLLGIYMSYKDKIPGLKPQLDLALRHHVMENHIGYVCLLLWAGADPRNPLPDIDDEDGNSIVSTALEEAVWHGQVEMIEKMKLDPSKDDVHHLLRRACCSGRWPVIEKFLQLGADPNAQDPDDTSAMSVLLGRLVWKIKPVFGYRSDSEIDQMLETVCKFADRGGRWRLPDRYRMRDLRRALTELSPDKIEKVVLKFRAHKVCSDEGLFELINTTKLKKHLDVRFIKLKAALTLKVHRV